MSAGGAGLPGFAAAICVAAIFAFAGATALPLSPPESLRLPARRLAPRRRCGHLGRCRRARLDRRLRRPRSRPRRPLRRLPPRHRCLRQPKPRRRLICSRLHGRIDDRSSTIGSRAIVSRRRQQLPSWHPAEQRPRLLASGEQRSGCPSDVSRGAKLGFVGRAGDRHATWPAVGPAASASIAILRSAAPLGPIFLSICQRCFEVGKQLRPQNRIGLFQIVDQSVDAWAGSIAPNAPIRPARQACLADQTDAAGNRPVRFDGDAAGTPLALGASLPSPAVLASGLEQRNFMPPMQ